MLKTVPASVRPVPAEYRTGAANCVKTSAVVPTMIGSGVCWTHDVLDCVDARRDEEEVARVDLVDAGARAVEIRRAREDVHRRAAAGLRYGVDAVVGTASPRS